MKSGGSPDWKELFPTQAKRTAERTSHTCPFSSSRKFLVVIRSSSRKPHVGQLQVKKGDRQQPDSD